MPPARDAALAVLICQARLWDWAELELASLQDMRTLRRRHTAAETPIWSHTGALTQGTSGSHMDTTAVLHAMAKAIDYEYVRSTD